jgi:hypothetical protein
MRQIGNTFESDVLSDITFLELFPVVIAVNIWGDLLRNKKILFHIDNKAVVCIINKKSAIDILIRLQISLSIMSIDGLGLYWVVYLLLGKGP